jgi:SNF2 family DNA or RNA helicase
VVVTPPPPAYAHQREALARFLPETAWALYWEPGVGKSKPTIDVACQRFKDGSIDRVLVVAPKIVHSNWITDEFPRHCWDDVEWLGVAWHSHKAKTKDQLGQCVRLYKFVGLKVLAISYNGICTEAGRDEARKFLSGGKCMMVADEIHRIKTPGAQRSKLTRKAGKLAKVRVGLTGTPITLKPFDVYAQILFLDPDFWKRRGIGSFTAFCEEFGVPEIKFWSGKKVTTYPTYKNLDKLKEIVATVGHRLLREDCIDLPPQVFVKRRFDLAPEQRRVYDQLVAQYRAELEDGTVLDAPLALQRLMRLHQVACGFALVEKVREVPVELADTMGMATQVQRHAVQICDDMPRLDALEDVLEDLPEQAIVWTRFRADAAGVMRRLNGWDKGKYGEESVALERRDDGLLDVPPLGPVAGRVDGTVGHNDREKVIAAFRAGRCRVLVANPMAMGIGITLNEAKTCIYYSQDYQWEMRVQSEARNYRIGQDRGVYVVDLVANKTLDEKLINALVGRLDVSSLVMGDKWKEWIR